MVVTNAFSQHARQTPDRIAVDLEGDRRTYGELAAGAHQVQAHVAPLRQAGCEPPRIALQLENSIPLLEAFLGIAMAGGVAVVINPQWPEDLQAQVLDQVRPVAQIVPDPATGIRFIPLSSGMANPSLENAANSPEPSPQSEPIQDDDPFYIGFTAGSTGFPKGVIRSHRSWIASLAASQQVFRLMDSDQVLVLGALIHSLSLFAALDTLSAGATLYLQRAFHPGRAVALLQQAPITTVVGAPALLGAIARNAILQQQRFPHLWRVISGGAILGRLVTGQLQTCFPKAFQWEYYGASELSFVSLHPMRKFGPMAVGEPFPGVQVSIRRESGEEAEPGEVGWIGVKSDMLCSGYLTPTQDGSGFRILEGWATVGDRGWMDDDGCLYLVGREQDGINLGGLMLYPAVIERALRQYALVQEAVVLGLPDEKRGDRLHGIVQGSSSARFSADGLRNHLHRYHLPHHSIPHRFWKVDAFPLTPSGKIARAVVEQWFLENATIPEFLQELR